MDECETENCGSRRFHVGDDGFTYCSESHRQARSGLITINDEVQLNLGRRSVRKDKHEAESGLSPGQGLNHYLLCLQWLLWKQSRWLIEVRGLPVEIEHIIRQLWTLRLQSLRSKIDQYENNVPASARSFTASQSEDESSGAESSQKRRKRLAVETLPRMLDCVCLCYMAIVLLRLPVPMSDLYNWIANGELLYYRSFHVLDPDMKKRLPTFYLQLLAPVRALEMDKLRLAIRETITLYRQAFGMRMPAINVGLLLYRWTRELLLPLECYAATLILARLLDDDFTYRVEWKRGVYNILAAPEIRLTSLLLISTKLLFPLDSVMRAVKRPTELAAAVFDWTVWEEAMKTTRRDPMGRLTFKEAISTTEADVSGMSDDMLDQYLEWFGTMYSEADPRVGARTKRENTFRGLLKGIFPAPTVRPMTEEDQMVSRRRQTALDNAVDMMHSSLKPRTTVPDTPDVAIPRIGDAYKSYARVSDLTGHAKVVYTEISKMVELPLESLVQSVFGLEKQLAAQQRDTDEFIR